MQHFAPPHDGVKERERPEQLAPRGPPRDNVDRNEWFATRATRPTSVASTVVRLAGTVSSRECSTTDSAYERRAHVAARSFVVVARRSDDAVA
jgi:hypothetical protein